MPPMQIDMKRGDGVLGTGGLEVAGGSWMINIGIRAMRSGGVLREGRRKKRRGGVKT